MGLFPDAGTVEAALARWEGFPVDREPRPLVFTGPRPQWFDRVAAELRASGVLGGPAVPEAELTAGQLEEARRYCRDVHTLEARPLGRIVRIPMWFATDRGDRRVPALVMLPDNRACPFVALEPEVEERVAWRPVGLKAISGEISTIGGDGRTLTYRFGAHPSCVAAYPSAVATETATAVFVSPVEQWLAGPDACWPSVVETHEVVVRLAAPLGNRVLVGHGHGLGTDTLGTPLTVLPG